MYISSLCLFFSITEVRANPWNVSVHFSLHVYCFLHPFICRFVKLNIRVLVRGRERESDQSLSILVQFSHYNFWLLWTMLLVAPRGFNLAKLYFVKKEKEKRKMLTIVTCVSSSYVTFNIELICDILIQ